MRQKERIEGFMEFLVEFIIGLLDGLLFLLLGDLVLVAVEDPAGFPADEDEQRGGYDKQNHSDDSGFFLFLKFHIDLFFEFASAKLQQIFHVCKYEGRKIPKIGLSFVLRCARLSFGQKL